MNPFKLLGDEHRLIARVCDAFDNFVRGVRETAEVDRRDLEDFVVWFREYEDLGHHDKEETILFPAMVRHGFRWDDGPVQAIRREHDQERYLTRTLRYAALRTDEWTEETRRHFLAVADEFVSFLRAHMDMENKILFPEAQAKLPEAVQTQLGVDMEKFDALRTKDGELEAMNELAERLAKKYA